MNLNYNKKEIILFNLFKYILINFPLIVINALILKKLGKKKYSSKLWTLIIVFLIYYIGHIYIHRKIAPNYNFHLLHHNYPYLFEIKHIELLINLFPLFLTLYTPRTMDKTIIIYCCLLYTSVHLLNYHVLKLSSHQIHHAYKNVNYGPEFFDILFLSKKNKTPFENLNSAIINSLFLYKLLIHPSI